MARQASMEKVVRRSYLSAIKDFWLSLGGMMSQVTTIKGETHKQTIIFTLFGALATFVGSMVLWQISSMNDYLQDFSKAMTNMDRRLVKVETMLENDKQSRLILQELSKNYYTLKARVNEMGSK